MSKEEETCQIENCSGGTCAPVSPFSKEGILFLAFIIILFVALFFLLSVNGFI